MEEVLEVSHRPHDPQRPVVCCDASRTQLVQETHPPIPAAAGRPVTTDDEYERNGTANLCIMCEPLGGQRRVVVTERRTATDDAHAVQHLVDEGHPHAEKIV